MGWVVAPPEVMEQIVVAKQASDLHSNYLSQRIAFEYLYRGDIDARIRIISAAYRNQCDLMIRMFEELLPESVTYTLPGGMFVWLTLPDGISSMDVFNSPSGSMSPSSRAPRFTSTGAGRIHSGQFLQCNT